MRNLIFAIIPFLLSCQKDQHVSSKYTVDTKVVVSLSNEAGIDMLKEIDRDNIELVSSGVESEKPLPYELDITLEPVSPVNSQQNSATDSH